MYYPGRLISSAGLACVAFVCVACGSSGVADHRTLKQLYNVEKDGNLTHAGRIDEETFLSRTFGSVLKPFGYAGAYQTVEVEDPGRVARETIRSLVESFEGNPELLALALPRLSHIAVRAPFDLTRAQATWALGRALRDHLPNVKVDGEPVAENDPSVEAAIKKLLIDEIATDAEAGPGGPPPSDADALAALDLLRRVAFSRDTATARRALRVAALYAASAEASAEARAKARETTVVLGRSLVAMTLVRASGRAEASPVVRADAAIAFRDANALWAEAALIAMVDGEPDPTVRRKVFRSIEAYRTRRVARRMLAVLLDDKSPPLDRVCARRALTAFTRKDYGDDADAWREPLADWL